MEALIHSAVFSIKHPKKVCSPPAMTKDLNYYHWPVCKTGLFVYDEAMHTFPTSILVIKPVCLSGVRM
jgi:hypothetical protein